VPGPDPMPIWFTIAIGVAGALIAGLVSQVVFEDPNGGFLLALVAAIVIVIGYRRFVQGRGITGPEAKRQPTRGIGVRAELEEKLDDLREAGLLTPEEFEAKRALLRSRV
jgi:membrane protein implicated in regulation of membrane protease activity